MPAILKCTSTAACGCCCLWPVQDSVLLIEPSAALACTDCVREEAAGPDGTPRLLVPPSLHDAQLLRLLEPYRRYRVWRLSFEGLGSTARAFAGFSSADAAAAFDLRMAHITTDFCCRQGCPHLVRSCAHNAVPLSGLSLSSPSGGSSSDLSWQAGFLLGCAHPEPRLPCRFIDGWNLFALRLSATGGLPNATASSPCSCRREEEAPRYHKEHQMSLFLNMTSQFSYSTSVSSSSNGAGREASRQQRRKYMYGTVDKK